MLRLDVIIPALDASATLGATLDDVAAARAVAVQAIVADGGSSDGTADLARARGAVVVDAVRGRGTQLAAGAEAGPGDWLLFLHADTRLPPGWDRMVAAFAADPTSRQRAASFVLAFDDDSAAARRLEAIADWRSRRLGLPYGDQGLLIARPFYDRLGGYRAIPLMEDVDLVRRIGRRRLATLPGAVVTSAARYRRAGYAWRVARNLCCLGLFYAGVPPRLIARLYG